VLVVYHHHSLAGVDEGDIRENSLPIHLSGVRRRGSLRGIDARRTDSLDSYNRRKA
jgi:hypothetical protein